LVIADLQGVLEAIGASHVVHRLLRTVLSKTDGPGQLSDHGGVPSLLKAKGGIPSAEGVNERGRAIAEVAQALDHGEHFAAVATSARSALSLYDAHLEWALGISDLEDDQGRDAVVRLFGLALIAQGLYEGDGSARAKQALESEGGRAQLAWFAAV